MALVGHSIQAALQLNNEPGIQQSTPSPERDKASTEVIAEAEQWSRTVVKLFNEGNYDKALPLAKRALELRETALGPDHELTQGALLNLAEIDSALKKYGEALKLFERLLKTHEKKVGLEDADTAVYLEKLAFLAYLQLDFNKSEAAYKRALTIREKTSGKDNAQFATSLYLLAEFYRFTGKVDKAEPLYEQAAILRGKILGQKHPDYLKAKDRYFCVAYETQQLNKLNDFAAKLGEKSQVDKADIDEGAVLNGRAIYLPKPSYEAARRERAQGIVVIKVTVDERGNVIEAADMCGGNPVLVKPSLQAAREARFTPTKLSGQPVKVSGVITYRFVQM
jgi:TonB family protein